jgi:branched-chain amino acid transport system permease protein
MAAAPFLVGALGFVLEALIIRRFYAAPIVAMLGTYALSLIIREIVRGLIGGLYLSVPEPIGARSRSAASTSRLGASSLSSSPSP